MDALGTPGQDARDTRHLQPASLFALPVIPPLYLDVLTRLLEALPPHARLILLGDKGQLAAVEAGSVFAEIAGDVRLFSEATLRLAELTGTAPENILPPDPIKPTRLRDCVVWFSRNYRFREDSGIGLLASMVNRGDAEAAEQWLSGAADDQIAWVNDCGNTMAAATLQRLLDGCASYITAMQSDPAATIEHLFERYNAFRILCAIRNSSRGVEWLNQQITAEFRRRVAHPKDRNERGAWFPGRPVLILRNDYGLRLFNGDIGLTWFDETGELRVYFPDQEGRFRAIPPVQLPEHETAFAMTVHKSQGSEFDRIALVLPAKHVPVVTRELPYTGITRTREQALLVGGTETLKAGIALPTRRHSGLIARLENQMESD